MAKNKRKREDEMPPDVAEQDSDRHAVGTPGGGTEVGGLAGRNYGDGEPDEVELHEAGSAEEPAEEEDAYAGFAGGAVGGTPAQGRSKGGKTHGGISPGGVHRGDSTIGADPDSSAD